MTAYRRPGGRASWRPWVVQGSRARARESNRQQRRKGKGNGMVEHERANHQVSSRGRCQAMAAAGRSRWRSAAAERDYLKSKVYPKHMLLAMASGAERSGRREEERRREEGGGVVCCCCEDGVN